MRKILLFMMILFLCISTAGAHAFQVSKPLMTYSSSSPMYLDSGIHTDLTQNSLTQTFLPMTAPLTAGPPSNPGNSGDAPGRSGDAPGQSGDSGSAGDSGDTGDSGSSGDAPGRSGDAPGQSDDSGSAGDSGDTGDSGSSGDAPGRSGDAPGQSGDAPGRSGDAPGQSGDAPGQSGDAPGQSGDAPGQSGDAPGQSGDAPGQSGDAPGRSGDVPVVNRGGVGEVKSDPETGRSIQSTIVRSPEEKAQLFISQGTVAELAGEHISQVTITEVVPESVPSVAADPTYRYTGEAIQCGPAGVTFSETVGVTFGPFSQERWDALMEETEQDPQQLVVEWYNEKVDGWERLDAVVNPQTRSVTAFTDHFTVFAMFISPGAQTPIVTEVVTPIESNGQILYPEEPEVEEENNEENSNPTNITTGNEKSDQSVTTNNNEDNADNNNILIEILRNIQKAIGINNSK